METKMTSMAWFLILVVVMTTLLVAANPVVSPSPPTEKEKTLPAMKNKQTNQQLSQGLTSAKLLKAPGKMRPQGKATTTLMTVESNQASTSQRPTKPDPSASPSHPSSSSSSAALGPPSGQKNTALAGERKKQRVSAANDTRSAGQSRGRGGGTGAGGRRRLGKEGATEGRIKAGGKGGGAIEATEIPREGSNVQLQQLKGPPSDLAPFDANLRYLLTGPVYADGLQNGGQQQPYFPGGGPAGFRGPASGSLAVDGLSSFALNDVPPLAMAEYLILTRDFKGFDDALTDIVAIGMMAPEEAEVYRESVGLEYDSLLRQEATADDGYQEADDVMNGGVQAFLPPLALEYHDYGSYGNPTLDDGRGAPFNPTNHFGPNQQREQLGEVLQQMLDSIASSYIDDPGLYKSSSPVVKTSSSSSSSSSSLEDQLKSLDQSAGKQAKGKTEGSKRGRGVQNRFPI